MVTICQVVRCYRIIDYILHSALPSPGPAYIVIAYYRHNSFHIKIRSWGSWSSAIECVHQFREKCCQNIWSHEDDCQELGKVSDFFPWLQADKLTSYHFTDADWRREPPGADTSSTASSMHVMFPRALQAFSSHTGVKWGGPGTCCTCIGCMSEPTNYELREPQYFVMGCQQRYLTLVLEEHIVILNSK